MKTLVTFYSRSGNTRKAGEEIAQNLNADIDVIIDKKNRNGISGFFKAVIDTLFRKLTEIENQKNPDEYGLVVVGTPVWAGNITPAIRTYLFRNKFHNIAFFSTYANKAGNTFDRMEQLSSKPLAVLGLKEKKIEESREKIEEFCRVLSGIGEK